MKKAPIAVALVLVFGLFAAALSLTPAIAQYGTGPSSTSTTGNTSSAGNSTTAGNTTTSSTGNTTSSNSTSTGSTFSARGTIATLIFDTGSSATTNQTSTSSTNTTSSGNATSSLGNMTSSGNTTSAGNTTLGQTMVGGNTSTGATGNTTGTAGSNTTTSSTGNTTSSSNNTTSTASTPGQPFIVSGDWSLSVQNGNVSSFKANMTMVHVDGTARHTHEVSNFKLSNGSMVQLPQNGTTLIFGTADISSNGSPKWTGVNTLIMIERFNVVAISFSSENTDNHFQGQPLYGVVHSLTQNGKEMVQTASTQTSSNSTGGNSTGGNPITQGAQNTANQAGGALNNLTQGIKNLFNGTK